MALAANAVIQNGRTMAGYRPFTTDRQRPWREVGGMVRSRIGNPATRGFCPVELADNSGEERLERHRIGKVKLKLI